jgi:hypothetical protein
LISASSSDRLPISLLRTCHLDLSCNCACLPNFVDI